MKIENSEIKELFKFEKTIPIIIALSPAKTRSIKTIWINIMICSDNITRSISYQRPFQQS